MAAITHGGVVDSFQRDKQFFFFFLDPSTVSLRFTLCNHRRIFHLLRLEQKVLFNIYLFIYFFTGTYKMTREHKRVVERICSWTTLLRFASDYFSHMVKHIVASFSWKAIWLRPLPATGMCPACLLTPVIPCFFHCSASFKNGCTTNTLWLHKGHLERLRRLPELRRCRTPWAQPQFWILQDISRGVSLTRFSKIGYRASHKAPGSDDRCLFQ